MDEIGDRTHDEAALRARRAESFGAHAAAYAEHRPDYPEAGIRWALEPLGGLATPEVIDLGAGTGKLTDGLTAVGARVTAVEPDDAMRAEFIRLHPGLTGLGGSAESIPLPDESVDAVLVGQALHWFDLPTAFPEIARVLRPAGVLAALWNTHDTTVEWVAELDRLSRSSVSHQRSESRTEPAHALFQPLQRAYFPHTQRCTAEGLTATIGTHSHALVVEPQERAELLDRVSDYLHGQAETATGEFDLPLRTLVVRMVLR